MMEIPLAKVRAAQNDPLHKAYSRFLKQLEEAKTFDEVEQVCQDIDNLDLKWFIGYVEEGVMPIETQYIISLAATALIDELFKHFKNSKDLSFHKKVITAVFKPTISYDFAPVLGLLSSEYNALTVVGGFMNQHFWLSNHKIIEALQLPLPESFLTPPDFKVKTDSYTPESNICAFNVENSILAIDHIRAPPNTDNHFTLIVYNLENSYPNVRELLLELFKRMAKVWNHKKPNEKEWMNFIMNIPWTNRNKYALLAILISVNHKVVIKHSTFDMSTFLGGLQIGLTMQILHAPSQSLVKAMITQEVFRTPLIELVARVLWDGEDSTVDNLIKFWFNTFEPSIIEQVYNIMSASGNLKDITTTSEKFHRLLVLRNAFKRTFKDPDLDNRVRSFACELPVKTEVFHILIDNVQAEQDRTKCIPNILILLKFLRHNISVNDSSFVEQVMRKMPDFFNLLSSKKFREVEIAKEIFGIIRKDLFQHGMEFGSYESTAFSLKLLQVILKQYFGNGKSTNIKGKPNFGNFLKDSNIWDLTSPETFMKLLKLVDDDEHSEIATYLLIEYFIATSLYEGVKIGDVPFIDWINKKVEDSFNETEIKSSVSTLRFFMLKLECSIAKDSAVHEILLVVDLLKSRFLKLKKDANPVKSMEEGSHLFRLMDAINFGLKRLDAQEVKSKVLPVLNFILKLIASHFLDFFCNAKETPSFELLEQKLVGLLQKSKIDNASDLKPKLLLFIWYTLHSCSQITDTIAKITNETMQPSEEEYQQIMSNCIDINIQILTRCCQQEVIDSASKAIGKITRIISKEFMKLCDRSSENAQALQAFLITLKKEIFASKRPASQTGDIQSSQGLISMAHGIISGHPAFLKFLVVSLVIETSVNAANVMPHEQTYAFDPKVMPNQLYLLASLIKDKDLTEHMLRHLDSILYSTFNAFAKSNRDVENALLQIVGAIIPKISNQEGRFIADGETSYNYEPKAVTSFEFFQKVPGAFTYATNLLASPFDHVKTEIVILELFSNFESRPFRSNVLFDMQMLNLTQSMLTLMMENDEKLRTLAAKCCAQWDKIEKIPNIASTLVDAIFETRENLLHSTCFALRFMIQRYESSMKFIGHSEAFDIRSTLRKQILADFKRKGFPGATNFYLRSHLLDLLMFVVIPFNHASCQSLLNETGISSHFGYQLWAEKVKHLQKN